jgi:hypothetical protein
VNDREYRRLRQQIEDEYRRKLDALEIVRNLSAGNTISGVSSGEQPIRRGAIDALVRDVVPQISGVFSLNDVMNRIEEAQDAPTGIDRSSVSSALKRLTGELLVVVEVGKGKRASRYRLRSAPKVMVPPDEPEPPPVVDEPPMEPITDDDIPS